MSATAVFVQLAGLALNGDVLAIAAAHRHGVNSYVLLRCTWEAFVPFRPFRPGVASFYVPFLDMRTYLHCKVFEPHAIRVLGIHLGGNADRLFYNLSDIFVLHSRSLLLSRPIEDPAPGVGPVENLRGVGSVDLVLRQSLQPPYLLLNV